MKRFRKHGSTTQASHRRKLGHREPRLEPLEPRQLLSVSGSWGTVQGDMYEDVAGDVAYGPDGSVYTTSSVQVAAEGTYELRLSKYDPGTGGQEVFSQAIISGLSSPRSNHIQLSENGDIYVAGEYEGPVDSVPDAAGGELPVYGGGDIFVARYLVTPDGPQLDWIESFGSAETDRLAALSLVDSAPSDPNADPDVCLVGRFGETLSLWDETELANTSGASLGAFVLRATAEGQLRFADELQEEGEVYPYDAVVTNSGELYVTGAFRGHKVTIGNTTFSDRNWEALVAKYWLTDTELQPLWAHQIAQTENRNNRGSSGSSIVVGSDGDRDSVFIAGDYHGEADFTVTSLPFVGYMVSDSDGFIVQVAENVAGQPENVWVRHLAAQGELESNELLYSEGTLYVATRFYWSADFDPSTPTFGDCPARGYYDMAVAEIFVEMDAAGHVQSDTLGRIWQMELNDDDSPAADIAYLPWGIDQDVAVDLSQDGRLALMTWTNSTVPLSPVGTLEAIGDRDVILLDVDLDHPTVEMTFTEPVVAEGVSQLAATAVDLQSPAQDLTWQWELWELGGATPLQETDTDGDDTKLTLDDPLELGGQYEVVVSVTDTDGNTTVYPFRFQAMLDPPQNLAAAVGKKTVTLTWDLPTSSSQRAGFVIEKSYPSIFGRDWEISGSAAADATSFEADMGTYPRPGLRYRVRSFSGTSEAMELLSPSAVIIVGETSDNLPPVATGDFHSTDEDTLLVVNAPGVLTNDSDPENDPLTAVLLDQATHGTVTLSEDGGFEYDPEANFHGTDSFTYRVFDGSAHSDPATVTINVTSVPDGPPVADAGGPYQVAEGQSIVLDASRTTDADLPYETLTYAWDFDGDGAYDDAVGVAPVFDATGLPAGATVTVGLRVTDSNGGTSTAQAGVVILPAPVTLTYDSIDTPLSIPDQGLVSSIIYVAESYTIAELTVQIDITHARPSDLTVTLTSQTGIEISLPPTGGSGAAFAGEDVYGTWTLNVIDGKKKKDGTLNSWSLVVTAAAAGGASSYALPPVAAVGSPTDAEDGIASLRKVESPRVRSMEGSLSTDRLQLLLRSDTRTQAQSTAVNRRGLTNWHEPNVEEIDVALAELEESLLDGQLAQLLATNWNRRF